MSRARFVLALAATSAVLAWPGVASAGEPADLVLSGGRVWTADDARPWAQAVAIRGDRIVYVGEDAGVAAWRGPRTQAVALGGRLVVPGFEDAHIHLLEGALTLDQVDLIEDQSLAAVQARIRGFARSEPTSPWVLGRGWLYGSFPGGLPTKEQLDAVVADRPAYMECYDYHTGWANSRALALAGITRDTPDPAHGEIVRDPTTHEPTGALKEDARALVKSLIPEPGEAERYARLLRALGMLNAFGITSVQDARSDSAPLASDLPLLERARDEGRLTLRIRAATLMAPGDVEGPVAEAKRLASLHPTGLLRFGAVKAYVDGVIEAHTAALLAPYSDDPSFGPGRPNWTPRPSARPWSPPIGPGSRSTSTPSATAACAWPWTPTRPPCGRTAPGTGGRLEHIETIDPADYPRFKALGVIASMQPLHANPDKNSVEVWQRNIGPERASRGFSWAAIEGAGGRLVFGSDWPVVTPDVFRGLYCAIARKTREGTPSGGWHPELAVSLDSALRHYTIDAAYAAFEEKERGSLRVGKKADLAVISHDLFEAQPEDVLKVKVLLTVMDGRVVHRAEGF